MAWTEVGYKEAGQVLEVSCAPAAPDVEQQDDRLLKGRGPLLLTGFLEHSIISPQLRIGCRLAYTRNSNTGSNNLARYRRGYCSLLRG